MTPFYLKFSAKKAIAEREHQAIEFADHTHNPVHAPFSSSPRLSAVLHPSEHSLN